GGGVNIEGADGAKVVLASAMPVQGIQQRSLSADADEYGESEMVEGALGATSSGLQQQDYEGFTGAPQRRTSQIVDPNSREATLSRKNNLVLSGLVLATITAGMWVTGTAFINRQTDLVDAFADEMTYHVGDEREMELCVKEYKGKLGPKLYREAMFKSCLLAIGQKKAVTLETVRAIKFIFKQFRLSPAKGTKLLVAATRSTDKSQSNVRSKLLFLGGLIAKGDEKAEAALEPLKKNVEASFPGDGANMLKIRNNNMAESALKAAIEAVPDGEMLESGWEELGMDDQWAARVATDLADDEQPVGGIDFYKTGGPATNDAESDPVAAKALAAMEADIEEKKTEPQDEKEPEAEGSAKSYECQVCSYKMFVAKGREFKFFGDDFKCPECGAGKNKFTEADMDDDLL
ncbi:unnamed protein product, partial [Hapterophycus canaliculatus]